MQKLTSLEGAQLQLIKLSSNKEKEYCVQQELETNIRGARSGEGEYSPPLKPKKIVVIKRSYFPGLYKMTTVLENRIENG